MKIETSQVTKLRLSELDRLDPVSVIVEDLRKGQGKITIECFGKAWSTYWGGMGDQTITEFFCDSNEHYIANKLSSIDSEVYDIDKIREDAEKNGIECWRDDPWNDHDFLANMYGSDMSEWHYSLPKMANYEYQYLCRIIKAVQAAFAELSLDIKNTDATCNTGN